MNRKGYLGIGVLTVSMFASTAAAVTIQINPVKDNTLYEDAEGDFSNGSGDFIFTGETDVLGSRRAVMQFDIAGNIPAGAEIEDVSLQLTVTVEPPTATPLDVAIHVLTADWGEGASDAGDPGGAGVPALPNDATWIHRFYNSSFWASPGGDFDPTASDSLVTIGLGPITFTSANMVDDVQAWLDAPASNFGWLVLADESEDMNARRFNSREHPVASTRPILTITYNTGEPVVPAVSEWGLAILVLTALAVGSVVFRRPMPQA